MALGGFFSRLKEGLSPQHPEADRRHHRRLHQAQAGRRGAGGAGGAADRRRSRPARPRKVIAEFRRTRFGKEVTDEEIKQALGRGDRRDPGARRRAAGDRSARTRPHVVLVVGVNGTGKTTTIGKLAQSYREQG